MRILYTGCTCVSKTKSDCGKSRIWWPQVGYRFKAITVDYKPWCVCSYCINFDRLSHFISVVFDATVFHVTSSCMNETFLKHFVRSQGPLFYRGKKKKSKGPGNKILWAHVLSGFFFLNEPQYAAFKSVLKLFEESRMNYFCRHPLSTM